MPTMTERRYGLSEGLAVKAPVRLATTEAVPHVGLPVIDGVQTEEGDAILDAHHVDARLRGIWLASSGNWTRRADFDGARDAVSGTRVFVAEGDYYAHTEFYLQTPNPIFIGTTSLTFGTTNLIVQPNEPGFITPELFGAVGDGVTDDRDALSDFINALNANPWLIGLMAAKVYGISGSLPDINTSGVRIFGAGVLGIHDEAQEVTIIKALAGCTGIMLVVSPTVESTAGFLNGVHIKGVTFDGDYIADKCLALGPNGNGRFTIQCEGAVSVGLHLFTTATGGSRDNVIDYISVQRASGVCLLIEGTTHSNWCYNLFRKVTMCHTDDVAANIHSVDNNVWLSVFTFNNSLAADYSIVWHGNNDEVQTARDEYFFALSTVGAPARALGTGFYTYPANNIHIEHLDETNGCPSPIIEAGASVIDHQVRETTPTPTTPGGNFSIATCTVRFQRKQKRVFFDGEVAITTNGLDADTYVIVPLPYASFAGGRPASVSGFIGNLEEGLIGLIPAGEANLLLKTTSGGYPGADGKTLKFSGNYEVFY